MEVTGKISNIVCIGMGFIDDNNEDVISFYYIYEGVVTTEDGKEYPTIAKGTVDTITKDDETFGITQFLRYMHLEFGVGQLINFDTAIELEGLVPPTNTIQ